MSTEPKTKSEKPKRKYTRKANGGKSEWRQEDAEGLPKGLSEDAKVFVKQVVSRGSEPAKDPQSGDKTPAYVQWYAENHTPEEFEAKYGQRKHPLNHSDN